MAVEAANMPVEAMDHLEHSICQIIIVHIERHHNNIYYLGKTLNTLQQMIVCQIEITGECGLKTILRTHWVTYV